MDSLRYLPHRPPLAAHTRRSTFKASQEYLRALALRSADFRRPGGRLAAATKRRRALSRLQPVTAQTSSRIHPLSFFDALVHTLAYFPVISTLACTRQPTSQAHHSPARSTSFAGSPT